MPSVQQITHVIVRLDTGGAERSLLRLIEATRAEFRHRVLCLGYPSDIGRAISDLGVAVEYFDYRRRGPLVVWQVLQRLRAAPPDLLQGWMYYGNVLVSLLSTWLPARVAVAWNIRQSLNAYKSERWHTRAAIRAARCCSPDSVIYNSHAGQDTHREFGFPPGPVIMNGIDTATFKPDQAERRRTREAHGVAPETIWVAMVCRFHPLKGVAEFLAASRRLSDQHHRVRISLAGPGMRADNAELMRLLREGGLDSERVHLHGPVSPVAPFLCGLDMLVLASAREGTPNILLEAMACGVTTVGTDVGDIARIIRHPARVCRPRDVAELTRSMQFAVDHLGQFVAADRAMVAEHYSIDGCIGAYRRAYAGIAR